ncbi:MAG TPA: hypothetical protein VMW32_00325 [Bacteroidales bacterium]|nr:hypothetical protein [Bacteroidales bacterium]
MKKLSRIFILTGMLIAVMFSYSLTGQEKEGLVKYTPDFRFNDGIYLNFDQVKMNSPIPKAKLLTSTDYNDREFFKKLFAGEKIYFYDGMGIRQEVDKNSIWGYARNGVLYILIQGNFNRITFVGSICHFVADITSYDNRYYNSPYGYYDPYYSPYSYYSPYYSPYSSPYYRNYSSPYGSYYSPYGRNMTRNELKQYLIDFESGKILEYDVSNAELLLMKDGELYEEYVKLSRKKKKEQMFVYIRKFNEKNPLYIPVN